MLREISNGIGNIFSATWKLALIIGIVALVGYSTMTCLSNCQSDGPGLPSIDKAPYEILIKNTGMVFYTDEYQENGSKFTISGYYELYKNKYRYRENTLLIDTEFYGPVKITVR